MDSEKKLRNRRRTGLAMMVVGAVSTFIGLGMLLPVMHQFSQTSACETFLPGNLIDVWVDAYAESKFTYIPVGLECTWPKVDGSTTTAYHVDWLVSTVLYGGLAASAVGFARFYRAIPK